jgi:heparin/heparan-sulfate lyase
VSARSSWDEDATFFFVRFGDRFTAHQHLDVGHFLIYRHEELAGDGGHYEGFGSRHDVNYHMRTVAHSTILVHDPSETWPGIRAGEVTGNDGGQRHHWPHHNGAVGDAAEWQKGRDLYDIADLLAFEDRGDYLYVAGDGSRAYAPQKLEAFVRQIVYIRPGAFVIFDRVRSTDAAFRKTWLLQAMKVPTGASPDLVITNGRGRLFVQTLLPRDPVVRLASGPDLYAYGGQGYPPSRDTGPAPECRIEVSPPDPAELDYFLHVLTAADATVASAPRGEVRVTDAEIVVTVGEAEIAFRKSGVGGSIRMAGQGREFATGIVTE